MLLAVALAWPQATAPALAIAPLNSVPMACPILTVADVAILGNDTIVLGPKAEGATAPASEYLLCRITAAGAATWTRTITDALRTEPAAVAVGAGNIYVGWVSIDASGWRHANVRRFGTDGTALQTATTASGKHDELGDVAVAPDGRVYLTGSTEGSLDGVVWPQPGGSAFVRSFEANLSVRWTRQFRGVVSTIDDPTPRLGFAFGRAIAADSSGVYVTGVVVGALPGGPAHRHRDDGFVRRYAADGALVWTRQFNSIYPDGPGGDPVELPTYPTDVALGTQGVHVVGASAWLGNRDVEHRQDAFQRVYSRAGDIVWTTEIGGLNDDGALRVVPDAAGSVMFGFAPEGLTTTAGPTSMFLARFGPTGAVEGILNYQPDGWWLQLAQITGDGKVIRIASIVDSPTSSEVGGDLIVPPLGRNLLRVDAVPPVVGVPVVHATPKTTMSSTSMSIDVTWTATDGATAVSSSQVQISRDGGAYASLSVPSAATRSVRTTGRPGGTIRVRARAMDAAGNMSPWVYGPTVRLVTVQETASAIRESASWGRVSQPSALGGHVDRTLYAGAWARYTFTGRGIAWIGVVGPKRGRADVYIDGVFVVRIDTYAASFSNRRVLFERAWSSAGSHTIEVRNRGTPGRTRIDLDAFIVLK